MLLEAMSKMQSYLTIGLQATSFDDSAPGVIVTIEKCDGDSFRLLGGFSLKGGQACMPLYNATAYRVKRGR